MPAKRSVQPRATISSFKTIALMGPSTDPKVAETLTNLAGHLVGLGLKVLIGGEFTGKLPAKFAKGAQTANESDIAARSDLVITIGGDGTMLRAARLLSGSNVPVVGINRGRLGFLADISPRHMFKRIDEVLAGKFERGSRALLEVKLIPSKGKQKQRLAVNDCVLQKWETGRILDYETWVDGQYVNTHGGDGVIVASATGSTAYALSCGGPIIHPSLDAMVIAPICPHTLSDRPIVISANSTVEIRRVQDRATKAQVTCDGDMLGDLGLNDRLLIGPANVRVNLLHPVGHDYYRILRSKLHWGRGAHNKRQLDLDGEDEA